jgi:hypothetical protein
MRGGFGLTQPDTCGYALRKLFSWPSLPEALNESRTPWAFRNTPLDCRDHKLRRGNQSRPDARVDCHQSRGCNRAEWAGPVCYHRNFQRVAHDGHSVGGELGWASFADVRRVGLYSQWLPWNRRSGTGDLRSNLDGDSYDNGHRSTGSEASALHSERAHGVRNCEPSLPINVTAAAGFLCSVVLQVR